MLDLLTCLLRRAGQVVTKNELMEQVWLDVVVTDESLTRCISDIRQALGDAEQAIIKTVPRELHGCLGWTSGRLRRR